MVRRQSRTNCSASIARRGLNPNAIENLFAGQNPVRHTVERHAACQTKVFLSRRFAYALCELDHYLFGYRLHRSREIHFPLGEFRFRSARGTAEQLGEAVIEA